MAKTQRFGFNYFDRATPGSLSDDAGKFTGRDRQLFDRLFGALEVHAHGGGDRLADPAVAPSVALSTSGGSLAAGQTFYYRVSYIDQFGLETAAGAEISVTTPAAIPAPPTPAVTAIAGGTLGAGVYYYGATWHAADGTETTMSAPAVINLQGDLQTVQFSFADPIPLDAAQVSIWRQGPLDGGFTRLATIATLGFTSYNDNGSVAPAPFDPENLPPDTNETNATNVAAITLPSAEIAPPTLVRRWRLYRTTTQGAYPAASLLAEVIETADELTGALVDTYNDDGTAGLLPGAPLEVSQTLKPSAEVAGGGGGGVGGQIFLADSGGTTWRIYTSGHGVLHTEALSTAVEGADLGLVLVDIVSTPWRLTVGTDGVLTTTQAEALDGERTWAYGTGPHVPTSDATVTWRLGVDEAGALVTFGGTERANRIHLESRNEPSTPTEGAVLWVTEAGELKFKNSLGTVATLAGP